MGLFSSSKLPQPPLPNLAIHLYNPTDKVFKPDDIVSGHIALTPIIPISPRAIDVALFGHSLIWHRARHTNSNDSNSSSYTHYRDNAPLFEVATNVLPSLNSGEDLESSALLEPGQTYTFPFNFRFPAGTANSRNGQYKKDVDGRWIIGPHDLPPTFLHTGLRGDGTDPDYAKIEYGVKVTLCCPGVYIVQKKSLLDMSATTPVLFQPNNRILQQLLQGPMSVVRYPKTFTFQSSTLTGQLPSQIGFRQNMRDRFSSSTPKLDFEATVEIPDIFMGGSEFRFRASFNTLSKTESVTKIPAIQFRILKLELLDFTFVRARQDYEASNDSAGTHHANPYGNMPAPDAPFTGKSEHTDFSERKTHLNSIPGSATVELEEVPGYENEKETEQAKSCDVWFTARIPGFTPPSFTSFAITRAYRVKVKLGIEVGGKMFELGAENHVRDMASAP